MRGGRGGGGGGAYTQSCISSLVSSYKNNFQHMKDVMLFTRSQTLVTNKPVGVYIAFDEFRSDAQVVSCDEC